MEKTCLNCKNNFKKPSNCSLRIWRTKKKFCSKRCSAQYKSINFSGPNSKCWKEYPSKKCPLCNQSFSRPNDMRVQEWKSKKFCSFECHRKGMSGKNNYWYGERHSEETKKQISEKKKGQHVSVGTEFKKGHPAPLTAFLKGFTPWNKNLTTEDPRVAKYVKKIALLQRQRWANKEYKEKQIQLMCKGLSKRPTSLEKKMISIIAKHSLPYKYVGDFSFWIGGKNPDFVNINGEKKLIEVGNEYHKKLGYGSVENYTTERKNHFTKYGWESFIFIGKLDEKEILETLEIKETK